jgi:hypothetical protein
LTDRGNSGALRVESASALGALALSAAAAALLGRGTGVVMFVLCLCGAVIAQRLGAPSRSVAILALGLTALVWGVLTGGFGHPRLVSTAAHVIASALVAFTLLGALRRWPPAQRAASGNARLAVAVAATLVVGIGWEIAEWTSDAVLGTDLARSLGDNFVDLAADLLGALAGAATARLTVDGGAP